MADCPLSVEALSPALHKHVDDKAPAPLRTDGGEGARPRGRARRPGHHALLPLLRRRPRGGGDGGQDRRPRCPRGSGRRRSAPRRCEAPVLDWLADRLGHRLGGAAGHPAQPVHLRRDGGAPGPDRARAAGGDHPPERAAPPAPRRHRARAVPEPQRARLHHRRRLRLLRPQRPRAPRRSAARRGAPAHPRHRPGRPGRRGLGGHPHGRVPRRAGARRGRGEPARCPRPPRSRRRSGSP